MRFFKGLISPMTLEPELKGCNSESCMFLKTITRQNLCLRVQSLNPRPSTLNPKPYTLNPTP